MTASELREQLSRAIAAREATVPQHRNDPALSCVGAQLARRTADANDRALQRWTEAERKVQGIAWRLARAEAGEAEAQRKRLTRDDVAGARAIRDQFGWHRVVRVNAKTVTVQTPYSWTERIAISDVLEAAS